MNYFSRVVIQFACFNVYVVNSKLKAHFPTKLIRHIFSIDLE